MQQQIEEKLTQAREKVLKKRRLEGMLAEAARLHDEARDNAAAYQRQLDQSSEPTDKLSEPTMGGLFRGVLGTKKENASSDRRKLLGTKLKLDEATHANATLRKEEHTLRNEIARLISADFEYEMLLKEKQRWTPPDATPVATPLDFSLQMVELTAKQRAIQAMLQATEAARAAVHEIRARLTSCGSDNQWNALEKGSSPGAGDCATHPFRGAVHLAQQFLRKVQVELSDADVPLGFALNGSSLPKFSDSLFDALLADWLGQAGCSTALAVCDSAEAEVEAILSAIRQRSIELGQEMNQLTQRWAASLELG